MASHFEMKDPTETTGIPTLVAHVGLEDAKEAALMMAMVAWASREIIRGNMTTDQRKDMLRFTLDTAERLIGGETYDPRSDSFSREEH